MPGDVSQNVDCGTQPADASALLTSMSVEYVEPPEPGPFRHSMVGRMVHVEARK